MKSWLLVDDMSSRYWMQMIDELVKWDIETPTIQFIPYSSDLKVMQVMISQELERDPNVHGVILTMCTPFDRKWTMGNLVDHVLLKHRVYPYVINGSGTVGVWSTTFDRMMSRIKTRAIADINRSYKPPAIEASCSSGNADWLHRRIKQPSKPLDVDDNSTASKIDEIAENLRELDRLRMFDPATFISTKEDVIEWIGNISKDMDIKDIEKDLRTIIRAIERKYIKE